MVRGAGALIAPKGRMVPSWRARAQRTLEA